MTKGQVNLYSKYEEVIRAATYDCVKRRKAIISDWEKYYGSKFKECYIVIVPKMGCLKINKDGTNSNNNVDYPHESFLETKKSNIP